MFTTLLVTYNYKNTNIYAAMLNICEENYWEIELQWFNTRPWLSL